MFELYTEVALARDVPEYALRRGDVATVVEQFRTDGGEEGFALEVFNALGETVKVVVVPASAIEPLTADEVWAVRPLAQTR